MTRDGAGARAGTAGAARRGESATPARRAAVAVVVGAAAWGTTGTAAVVADVDVAPALVGAARMVAGSLVLLGVVAGRSAVTGRPASGPSPARARVRAWPVVATIVAGTAVAAYQFAFFGAVERVGVAVGTVVTIGSSPVLAGLLGWLVDRVRPTRRWWAATAAAVAGCALVAGPSADDGAVDPVGVLLALGAGLAYAVLVVAQRRVLQRGVPHLPAIAVVLTVGALPSLVVLLLGDAGALLSLRGVLLAAWLGIVTTGIGHGLWASGVAHLPTSTVGTLTLTEPLVAALLGVVLLGERPTASAGAGAALLAAGLVVVALPSRRVVPG